MGEENVKKAKKSIHYTIQLWGSALPYPSGDLVGKYYPHALVVMAPTDRNIPNHLDSAALALFRDRQRGILNYKDSV